MTHAPLASVSEPDETQRRIWTAQVSLRLPVIEMHRREIVREYRHPSETELRRTGRAEDSEPLEIGESAFLMREAGFNHDVASRAENLRLTRNAVARSRILKTSPALVVAQSATNTCYNYRTRSAVNVGTLIRKTAARRLFLGSIPPAPPSLSYNFSTVNYLTSTKRTEHLEASHTAGPMRNALGHPTARKQSNDEAP